MILIAGACRAEPPSLPENLSVAWSPPRVINDDGRGVVQFDPALSTAPDGSVHAAWVDFRDGAGVFGLYHARRPAAGDAWEHNERVSDLIGAVCRDDPDVAIDSAGAVHIVWSDYRNVHPDIFVSTKAPGAGAWSAPRVVNDDTTETIQWSPAIAADHEGGVWVTWSDYRDGDGAIYASRRDVDGSWTPNERVDDAPAGQQDRPAIAIAPTGEVFVAWHDMRDDLGDVSAARRDPLTGEWSRAVRLNALPEGRQASPTLAIDAGGVVIAAWYDEHDSATIHAATLDPSVGASDATAATGASGERTYSDDWSESRRVSSPTGRIAERPAAAAGAGTALVTWYEHIGIDGVIMASERLPGIGTGWSAPERIDGSGGSSAGRNPAAVIAPDGRAHIAWYGEGDLRQKEIFHSTSEIEEPESFEAEGRLIYSTGRDTPGCPADGFTLVGCDGERHVLVAAGAKVEAQLDAALGRIVRVAGVTRAGIGDAEICRLAHVMAIDVDPAACAGGGVEPPPPPGTGAIVGRVFVSALASPGGSEVEIAGRRISVGSDGRFFADAVPAGSHRIRTAGRCALVAEMVVNVPDGDIVHVRPVTLRSGDANDDCAIDLRDLVAVGSRYGFGPKEELPCADVNGDGSVDLFDLASVSSGIGSACPAEWASAGTASTRVHESRTVRVEGSIASSTLDRPSPVKSGQSRLGIEHVEVPIVISESSGIVGFSITMRFDASGTRVVDALPDVPGHQAADVGLLPELALVAANAVDHTSGRLHVAVSGLDPAASGERVLARLRFEVDSGVGGRPRVIGFQLAGPGGSPVPARVEVGGFVAAPAFHLWLPHTVAEAMQGDR